jgi:glycosyltransferase involved in cell wall biosynthesis
MRIGIHPALNPHDGGIYQYTVTLLDGLHELSQSGDVQDEFVVFAHDPDDSILTRLWHPRWSIKPFRPPWAPRSAYEPANRPDPDLPGEQTDMGQWLRDCGVDLMIFPSPHRLSFESGVPFVMAIHDLQHRLQPEFPEVSSDGEGERREYLFRNAARSATLLIADSQTGREDIVNCYGEYGVTPDRVGVLPYLTACRRGVESANMARLRVRQTYSLPDRYLFYPAQFWPHKNHLRLVDAIGLLRKEFDLCVPLVLAGSSTGALREAIRGEVERRRGELGVAEQVILLGYVGDEDVTGLYAGAAALVMPTFFGPTNIPILEAWSLECPVLTSDIRGIREQVGDAAILVDPRDVNSIAEGIRRLWTDETLRRTLVVRGRERLTAYTPEDYGRSLLGILGEAKDRVRRSSRVAEATC